MIDLAPNANDGTLDGAVAAMPDEALQEATLVSFQEAQNRDAGLPPPDVMRDKGPRRREDNGQFAKQEPPAKPEGVPDPAAKDALAVDAKPDAADDDWFELPPEKDGDAPRRVKATDVWDGYQRSLTMQQEIEDARRQAPPPVEWDQQMYQTVHVRGRLIDQLQNMIELSTPRAPDMTLINPSSPHYNPDEYHRQMSAAQQAHRNQELMNQRREQLLEEQNRERSALMSAYKMREAGKLQQLWPELADPGMQRRVVDDGSRYYGLRGEDFAQMLDSRHYAVLKDALAYRELMGKRQSAVKVVRSVPKLVKSSARSNQPEGQARYASSMQRLARSGSTEDGADAIGAILGLR